MIKSSNSDVLAKHNVATRFDLLNSQPAVPAEFGPLHWDNATLFAFTTTLLPENAPYLSHQVSNASIHLRGE